jgi:putative glutamine amidotransferase
MPAPRIGITVDNRDKTLTSGRYDVGVGYSRAVAAAGGLPLLLPHEPGGIDGYVEVCDGLILTGGVDPDTAALPREWPGHAPLHPQARVMDPGRQRFELALLDRWESAKPASPFLGICLGMQLLALRHGGRLNQYLPGTHPATVVERHRLADHAIDVLVDDSPLPRCDRPILSNHQQAISDAGRLRVTAVAEDGIIEAVDDPAHPFRLGVQWHPERPWENNDHPLGHGLIARFVAASRHG